MGGPYHAAAIAAAAALLLLYPRDASIAVSAFAPIASSSGRFVVGNHLPLLKPLPPASSRFSASMAVLFATRGGGNDDDDAEDDGDDDDADDNDLRTVLVTGGTGYIGSHTCLELLSTGRYRVVVIDNLANSDVESLNRVRDLLGSNDGADERLHFRDCDIRDAKRLDDVLSEFPNIGSCIHFAGLKAVGESVALPLDYYDVNVGGTTNLLKRLNEKSVRRFVFSSSATVYGQPETLPLREDARLSATNPYGRTKLFIEEILRDLYASMPKPWNILILRYFNPIGAHPSGRMGEDPQVSRGHRFFSCFFVHTIFVRSIVALRPFAIISLSTQPLPSARFPSMPLSPRKPGHTEQPHALHRAGMRWSTREAERLR